MNRNRGSDDDALGVNAGAGALFADRSGKYG